MRALRWLLLIPALVICLPLVLFMVVVCFTLPPMVAIAALVILSLFGLWIFSRTRVKDPVAPSEFSLAGSSWSKEGLL